MVGSDDWVVKGVGLLVRGLGGSGLSLSSYYGIKLPLNTSLNPLQDCWVIADPVLWPHYANKIISLYCNNVHVTIQRFLLFRMAPHCSVRQGAIARSRLSLRTTEKSRRRRRRRKNRRFHRTTTKKRSLFTPVSDHLRASLLSLGENALSGDVKSTFALCSRSASFEHDMIFFGL